MLHRLIRHPLGLVILLAVGARAAVMVRGSGTFDDPDNYRPLAQTLAAGEGFAHKGRPTAYRPPLYPVLLAPILWALGDRADWGIALLHLGLGAGTVWMTAAAARGWGLSDGRVVVAALVVACDPVLIWQSRSVMTETPAAFLVAASLAGLSRGGWWGPAWGGLGLGLAGLCRPSLLAGAVLTVLAGLVVPPGTGRDRLARSGLLAITVALVLLPWMVRNLWVFGEPVWTTTHGGYTLALANNPVYYREVLNGPPGRTWTGPDQWSWWDSVNRATAGMSEPQADRVLKAMVWRLARERPREFCRASWARLGRFWGVAPAAAVYSRLSRWATRAWTLPLWIALALGLVQASLWRWPRIAAPLLVIGLTLVHAVFWTDLRMRAPIVPAIALIAAAARLPRARLRRADAGVLTRRTRPRWLGWATGGS
ncbi:MAG TPA: phospholipid carrier-dependent glycosyltransferase [Isosphaeraceae bacterium]|nr:phospholipid carrier-dependent glycosyltransferase [Isosphaeraceae bacterium]